MAIVITNNGEPQYGNPIEQVGSLKNLALAVFGRQNFDPYPSETRRVHIETVDGRVPLDFQHLLPTNQ